MLIAVLTVGYATDSEHLNSAIRAIQKILLHCMLSTELTKQPSCPSLHLLVAKNLANLEFLPKQTTGYKPITTSHSNWQFQQYLSVHLQTLCSENVNTWTMRSKFTSNMVEQTCVFPAIRATKVSVFWTTILDCDSKQWYTKQYKKLPWQQHCQSC